MYTYYVVKVVKSYVKKSALNFLYIYIYLFLYYDDC